MTKPTIVTRASKGSALTWTEGDSNFTNLRDATITIQADTGGTNVVSDLNGAVTLVAGTNVTITGDNTAKTVTINSTASGGATTLDGLTDVDTTSTAPTAGQTLIYNGSSTWFPGDVYQVDCSAANTTNATHYPMFSSSATGVSALNTDTGFTYNPSTGVLTATEFVGSLTGLASAASNIDVAADNTNAGSLYVTFVSTQSGQTIIRTDTDLVYQPSTGTLTATKFTGALNGSVGATTPSTGAFTTLSASSTVGLSPANASVTISPTGTGTVTINPTVTGSINNASIGATTSSSGAFTTLSASSTVSGTGFTNRFASPGPIGSTTASTGAFTTLSASSTVSGTGFSTYLASPPAIGGTTAAAGSFTTLSSSGLTTANSLSVTTNATLKDIRETVFSLTYALTITPDVANGSIQKVTLTGNVTFSAFANPVAGQSMTLIVTQDATGGRTLTSTMKFSGGSKTLSTAANAIDIISVFYDGTNYYASLGKAFA